jgi:hypothetical protein
MSIDLVSSLLSYRYSHDSTSRQLSLTTRPTLDHMYNHNTTPSTSHGHSIPIPLPLPLPYAPQPLHYYMSPPPSSPHFLLFVTPPSPKLEIDLLATEQHPIMDPNSTPPVQEVDLRTTLLFTYHSGTCGCPDFWGDFTASCQEPAASSQSAYLHQQLRDADGLHLPIMYPYPRLSTLPETTTAQTCITETIPRPSTTKDGLFYTSSRSPQPQSHPNLTTSPPTANSTPHTPFHSNCADPEKPQETCFFWYHGDCRRGAACDRKHEARITWPISIPPGFVHWQECSLPLCPLRKDLVSGRGRGRKWRNMGRCGWMVGKGMGAWKIRFIESMAPVWKRSNAAILMLLSRAHHRPWIARPNPRAVPPQTQTSTMSPATCKPTCEVPLISSLSPQALLHLRLHHHRRHAQTLPIQPSYRGQLPTKMKSNP